MTKEEADFIGALNMCDEISNEAYKKIMCHCEEQEPCGDAISRQQAIDACLNGWNKGYEEIVEEIRALPPVKPAEKVGHWIKLDNCSNSGYYCSECQKRVVKEGWSDTVKIIKYCPNCGAKMEDKN